MGLCVVCVEYLVHERHSIVGKAATQDPRPCTSAHRHKQKNSPQQVVNHNWGE